nr:hypothetical protein [Tanacetum cinerariifolium]
ALGSGPSAAAGPAAGAAFCAGRAQSLQARARPSCVPYQPCSGGSWIGNHRLVGGHRGGGQAQRAHGLAVHGGVGALREAEGEWGSHAAVAFLNVGVVVHHHLGDGLGNGASLHQPKLAGGVLGKLYVLRAT